MLHGQIVSAVEFGGAYRGARAAGAWLECARDRARTHAGSVHGEPRGAAQRRSAQAVAVQRDGSPATGPPTVLQGRRGAQAGAGHICVGGGAGAVRRRLVARAGGAHPQAHAPGHPRPALLARDHLPGHLREAARESARRGRRPAAPRPCQAPPAHTRQGPPRPAPPDARHPCASRRDRGAPGARPLGGRHHQGTLQPLRRRHAGRAQDPLRHPRQEERHRRGSRRRGLLHGVEQDRRPAQAPWPATREKR